MDSTKKIIAHLRNQLNELPVDAELLTKLGGEKLLPESYVKKITKFVEDGKMSAASRDLITCMYEYYDVETLEKFCTCLEEFSKDARPALKRYAVIIRKRIEEDKNTDETDLENGTKKRKVDDESVDYIPDSGISCKSTQMSTNTEHQQPKEKAETKTEIAWKWYSTPFSSTCCSATACDDVVYVMAKGESKKADKICTYNEFTEEWTEIEEPPGSISSFSIASLGNSLYLTGGKITNKTKSKTTSNQVLTWNITQKKWEAKLPDMQEGRFCHGSGSFSDYLVVAGGINTHSIEIINCNTVVENKGWVKVISLPKNLVWPYLAASNKHLYFGFGYTDGITQPSNYLAALTQDKLVEAFKSEKTMNFKSIENLPLPPHELPALAVIGNKLLALGGRTIDDEKHNPESSVSECYILVDHKRWAPLHQKMESSRCSACVATVSDGIVVMGGMTITPRVSYNKPQTSTCTAVEKAQIV